MVLGTVGGTCDTGCSSSVDPTAPSHTAGAVAFVGGECDDRHHRVGSMSQHHARANSTNQKRDRDRIRRAGAGCHICGQPIDYSLPRYHPGSFVVDHLVPLSKGGADDMSNKAAAHWSCNDAKRARAYAPIVRRSGTLG